jgi:hypothetical protein
VDTVSTKPNGASKLTNRPRRIQRKPRV